MKEPSLPDPPEEEGGRQSVKAFIDESLLTEFGNTCSVKRHQHQASRFHIRQTARLTVTIVISDPTSCRGLQFSQLLKRLRAKCQFLIHGIRGKDGEGQFVGCIKMILFESGINEAMTVPKRKRLVKIALRLVMRISGFGDSGHQQQVSIGIPSLEEIGRDSFRADDFPSDIRYVEKLIGAKRKCVGGFTEKKFNFA